MGYSKYQVLAGRTAPKLSGTGDADEFRFLELVNSDWGMLLEVDAAGRMVIYCEAIEAAAGLKITSIEFGPFGPDGPEERE